MPELFEADQRREQLSNLIKSVALGDRRALSNVYDLTSAKLFGVCLRIVRDHDAAEDILQQVYIKVWDKAGQFERELASPITWLCAIARHSAIDWVRKNGAPVMPPTQSAISFETHKDLAFEAFTEMEDRAAIFDCIQTLPLNQRRAICLAFYDGSSHSELAEVLKVPLGTIKSWIRRGLQQLRGCLDHD